MKKLTSLLVILSFTFTSIIAQDKITANSLLDEYFNLKNALVSGDAGKAGLSAEKFSSALEKTKVETLQPSEQKVFLSLNTKLAGDARKIATSKDINTQRETFSTLSDNMILLAKSLKLNTKELYVDYCPMKKTYWLSEFQDIKNPYYGNAMLTCGNVKETIKP